MPSTNPRPQCPAEFADTRVSTDGASAELRRVIEWDDYGEDVTTSDGGDGQLADRSGIPSARQEPRRQSKSEGQSVHSLFRRGETDEQESHDDDRGNNDFSDPNAVHLSPRVKYRPSPAEINTVTYAPANSRQSNGVVAINSSSNGKTASNALTSSSQPATADLRAPLSSTAGDASASQARKQPRPQCPSCFMPGDAPGLCWLCAATGRGERPYCLEHGDYLDADGQCWTCQWDYELDRADGSAKRDADRDLAEEA